LSASSLRAATPKRRPWAKSLPPALTTVAPDEDLDRALQLLAEQRVRRLPVVEGEKLVGIVAQADIARRGDDAQTGQVVEHISEK
jgi:CBS domain-containing protein